MSAELGQAAILALPVIYILAALWMQSTGLRHAEAASAAQAGAERHSARGSAGEAGRPNGEKNGGKI